MSPPPPDPATSVAVVETPTGLEIRMRELRRHPATCLQVLAGGALLSVAGLVVAFQMEQQWPREWTRTGVWGFGGSALGLSLLLPIGALCERWRHELVIDHDGVMHHFHTGETHLRRPFPFKSILRLSAKPALTFIDPHGDPVAPLLPYTDAEQQHVYRLIVGYLQRTGLLPGLHELDEWEARIETLEKPAQSCLLAEVGAHSFRVEFALPKVLPNERNFHSGRTSLVVAGVAAGVAALALGVSALTNLPQPLLLLLPCFIVGVVALGNTVSSHLGRIRADESTRALTQAISVVGDLLVRTTGLGDKQVWRRGEVRDIGVIVALGTSDSEGNTSPDTASLSLLTWQGQTTVLRWAIFDRGRNETPREEFEWIASQLRLALKLYTPPSAAPTPAALEESPPSSSAIVANQRDVQT